MTVARDTGRRGRDGMSVEVQTLVWLLRDLPGGKLTLLPDVCWPTLLEEAFLRGVLPLVLQRLRTLHPDPLPAAALERCRPLILCESEQNLRLNCALADILPALAAAGIRPIVLKGAFLGPIVYGDVRLRPLSDIDLLVPLRDLPQAEQVLLDLGASPCVKDDSVLNLHECLYLHRERIELHWNLCPPGTFAVDLPGLWQRALPVQLPAGPALALCPEDLLLHLCLHAFQHRLYPGLRLLADVRAVIGHYARLDWPAFVARALSWQAGKAVALVLALVQERLAVAVPAGVLDTLFPGGPDPALLAAADAVVWTNARPIADNMLCILYGRSLDERWAGFRAFVGHTWQRRPTTAASAPTNCAVWFHTLKQVMRRQLPVLVGLLNGDPRCRAQMQLGLALRDHRLAPQAMPTAQMGIQQGESDDADKKSTACQPCRCPAGRV